MVGLLFECLLTVSLSSIFLCVAYHSYDEWMTQSKQRLSFYSLISELNVSQAQAWGRGKALVYCGSHDGRICDGQWSSGRLLFDPVSQHVVSFWSNPLDDHLRWSAVLSRSATLCFNASGLLQGSQGRFFFSGGSGDAHSLLLGRSGQVHLL